MSNITLSAAMRTNLLTLRNTQDAIGTTQNRLATGLRVSSAIDDPRNFFQAQGLNNRASDLTRRLDGMAVGIKTLQAADKGIKAMVKVVESMATVVKDAMDNPTNAASLMTQFNNLRTQLGTIARDSGFNGVNLLAGNNLTVQFAETANASSLQINAVNWNGTGTNNPAGIAEAADWAATDATAAATARTNAETAVQTALTNLRNQAATFGNNLTVVQIREGFTRDMVDTLKAGADALTLADQNEEAANLLALQTRQQLGVQALSLAAQSQQSILRLLG